MLILWVLKTFYTLKNTNTHIEKRKSQPFNYPTAIIIIIIYHRCHNSTTQSLDKMNTK